ncbi:MAG: methionine--tRNA ligase [Candidatus Omnitrophota bacterium]
MNERKQLYITTPLYYVNAKPHIGHSYTQIACDTIARYEKQSGRDVFLMTGTDEHGEKIEKAALDAGLKPGDEKKFVDSIVPHFKDLWEKLGIKYDHFIRTTDNEHVAAVQRVLSILREKGKFCKKSYSGWFCTPCEMFWTTTQSKDGICPDCERKLEKLDEENYFFKLSEYQRALIDHIQENPRFVMPAIRRNEVLSFLENNELQDLCISRPKSRLRWGIEIPFDRDFVTYVWFDALINYISGIGFNDDRKRFHRLWPADYQMIGKDILRHHAIYWPIMLMAIDLELPKTVFAHGWWVIEGEKMSKSKGNIIDPLAMIAKYGVEPFRYYLLSAVRFGADGVFSEELFVKKYNSDLANDIGNLLNRTLTMVEKYFGGAVPDPNDPLGNDPLRQNAKQMPARVHEGFRELDFSMSLKAIWDLVGRANKYIEESAPWKLAKDPDKGKLGAVIYNLAQSIGIITVSLYPFMPETSRNIWKQLGMETDVADLVLSNAERDGISFNVIPAGTTVKKAKPLFPRIEV